MALREAGMSGSIIVCTQARAAADGLNSGGDVMIYQWSRLTLAYPPQRTDTRYGPRLFHTPPRLEAKRYRGCLLRQNISLWMGRFSKK